MAKILTLNDEKSKLRHCPASGCLAPGATAGTLRLDGSARGQKGQAGRLSHYERAKFPTAARVRRLILAALGEGPVSVLVYPTPEPAHYGPLPLDLAAGIEAGLIARLRPAWNRKMR